MIYIKIHDTENGKIVAMCDEEFIGKVFKEGKRELDLERYSNFYKGELVSPKKVEEMIRKIEIYSANAVGNESIHALRSNMSVSDSEVKHIGDVPFVQIYTMI